MTIHDGGSSTSPIMGRYCGDSIPPSLVSSSNEIWIHFYTSSYNYLSENFGGFQMEYNPAGKQNTFQKNTEYRTKLLKLTIVHYAMGKL